MPASAATNVTRLPLKPARPTIEIDGRANPLLEAALVAYEIGDSVESMARAELSFGNWGGKEKPGFQHFDRKVLDFGKPLKVKLGEAIIFEGRISAISAEYPEGTPPQISVLAEDRLFDLRMTRRSRSFLQKSLADVARAIANDHGLQAKVTVNTPTFPVLVQLNQSDLAFLTSYARRFDCNVYAEGSTLFVAPARDHDTIRLAWAGTLRSFNVIADLSHQRTGVAVSGWNDKEKEGFGLVVNKSALGQELGGDEAGEDILRAMMGDRNEYLSHYVPANANEGEEVANASYRHIARGFVTGDGVCETDEKLKVGAPLELKGLGPLFDGKYLISSIRHLFDPEDGARSEFRCNRPGLGRPQ